MAHCEIPYKRGEPKAPSAIHSPLDPIFYPLDNGKVISFSLENQSSPHKLCDHDRKLHVESRVHDILTSVEED
jgi:hypothetical protein